MVTPGRFELPTCGLGNRCSIHLSYGATLPDCTKKEHSVGWSLVGERHGPAGCGFYFALGEVVVPGEFEDCRGGENDCERGRGAAEFLDDDVERQSDEADLPYDADGDVEHVAREVAVAFEGGIF